jgi:hypothetical protein
MSQLALARCLGRLVFGGAETPAPAHLTVALGNEDKIFTPNASAQKGKMQLVSVLQKNINDFAQKDPKNAQLVRKVIEDWGTQKDDRFLDWLKKQDSSRVLPFHSYLFWLWRRQEIEQETFEDFYGATNQLISQSWSMPLVITTGIDDPVFEGGFIDREFSVFQFKFTPSHRSLLIIGQEYPKSEGKQTDLGDLLDFLSFLLGKSGSGYLGFRQIISRKTVTSYRSLTGSTIGAEIQNLPDYDFEIIENALLRVGNQLDDNASGLTLSKLLHIRHRAILDSNLESKLITLWASMEAQWGEENNEDHLLTEEERKQIKKAISFLPENKSSKVIDRISSLKSKTKNDRIIEGISKLDCSQGKNVNEFVRDAFKLRSKFSHGEAMKLDNQKKINEHIAFMLMIIEELIVEKFAEKNIQF